MARSGRAAHGAGLGRFERQCEAQRHRRDEVDPEDLDRGDRQAHPERKSEDDGHRFAAIGGQGPAYHLLDVVIDGAPFAHGGRDRGEIVVGEHDLGGLLGRFAALLAHRDARVGAFEGGRVVHPVAGHRHGEPARLQRGDEAQFVFGRGAGENVGLDHRFGEGGVVHGLEIVAGENTARVPEPDLGGDGAGGGGVITGDHLDPDAGVTVGHRRDRLGAGRVNEAHEADKGQPPVEIGVAEAGVIRGRRAGGQRQHALSVGGEGFDPIMPPRRIERFGRAVGAALVGAEGEDGLGRALDVDMGRALGIAVERRHVAMRGVERDRVGATPAVERGLGAMDVGLGRLGDLGGERDERALHRVALAMPAGVGSFQHRVIAQPGHAGAFGQPGVGGIGFGVVIGADRARGS